MDRYSRRIIWINSWLIWRSHRNYCCRVRSNYWCLCSSYKRLVWRLVARISHRTKCFFGSLPSACHCYAQQNEKREKIIIQPDVYCTVQDLKSNDYKQDNVSLTEALAASLLRNLLCNRIHTLLLREHLCVTHTILYRLD